MTDLSLPAPEGMHFLAEAATIAGLSYRQADFWISRGYANAKVARKTEQGLVVDEEADGRHPGTGNVRLLDGNDVTLLITMAELVEAGFTVQAAAGIAPRLAADEGCDIGDSFRLVQR